MSISRKFLKSMSLTDEQIEAVIEENSKTIEAIKAENDKLKEDIASLKKTADSLPSVQKELDEAKQKVADYEELNKKYEDEKSAFEAFKKDVETKNSLTAIKDAYKALLKSAKVDDKRLDTIMKVTDFANLKLNKDGKFDNEKDLAEAIKTEWSDFIVTTKERGEHVDTPPANTGSKMTKADIMKIKDTEARQKAIAENPELFGIAE